MRSTPKILTVSRRNSHLETKRVDFLLVLRHWVASQSGSTKKQRARQNEEWAVPESSWGESLCGTKGSGSPHCSVHLAHRKGKEEEEEEERDWGGRASGGIAVQAGMFPDWWAISKFKCPLTGVPHPPAMGLKEFLCWASLLAACSLGGAWLQCRRVKDPEGSSQCCETLMFLATGSLEGALAGAPLWPPPTHYTESSPPLSSKHFISSS